MECFILKFMQSLCSLQAMHNVIRTECLFVCLFVCVLVKQFTVLNRFYSRRLTLEKPYKPTYRFEAIHQKVQRTKLEQPS